MGLESLHALGAARAEYDPWGLADPPAVGLPSTGTGRQVPHDELFVEGFGEDLHAVHSGPLRLWQHADGSS